MSKAMDLYVALCRVIDTPSQHNQRELYEVLERIFPEEPAPPEPVYRPDSEAERSAMAAEKGGAR